MKIILVITMTILIVVMVLMMMMMMLIKMTIRRWPPVSPTRLSSDWVAINQWIMDLTPTQFTCTKFTAIHCIYCTKNPIHCNTLHLLYENTTNTFKTPSLDDGFNTPTAHCVLLNLNSSLLIVVFKLGMAMRICANMRTYGHVKILMCMYWLTKMGQKRVKKMIFKIYIEMVKNG